MGVITLKIVLAAGAVIWLLSCLLLYRLSRDAAWLAASTVSSCLFFLGVTVLTSILVPGALLLAPLWLGVLVLAVCHLYAAHRDWMGTPMKPGPVKNRPPPGPSPPAGERSSAYI